MIPIVPVYPEDDARAASAAVFQVTFAEDQPEYQPLPSIRTNKGAVITRWKMTAEEMAIFLETGDIYLTIHTNNEPLQPVNLSVDAPEFTTL